MLKISCQSIKESGCVEETKHARYFSCQRSAVRVSKRVDVLRKLNMQGISHAKDQLSKSVDVLMKLNMQGISHAKDQLSKSVDVLMKLNMQGISHAKDQLSEYQRA